MNKISLKLCDWNKTKKSLSFASEYMGMPFEFVVVSEKTGREVSFKAVQYGDPLFCEDGWDGEQQVYRPVSDLNTIEYAVIYNQY